MGGGNSIIETSQIDESTIKAKIGWETGKYVPPFRKFGQLYRKNLGGRSIQYLLPVIEPYAQEFSLSVQVYRQLQEAFTLKTQNLVIQGIFQDEEFIDRIVYQTSEQGTKSSLLIRPFSNDESHTYSNIICEVHYYQLIRDINSPYLHKLLDSFVVHTGIQTLNDPNSHILKLEPADIHLGAIISYRRQVKWDWTEQEFERLTQDLTKGLAALHAQGISHNDIRPSTIYFSLEKNSYLLGSFGGCLKREGNINSTNVKSQSHYNPPQVSHQSQVDLLKADVYALGLTLLCAFFLTEPINRNAIDQLYKTYQGKYEILKLIKNMTAPADQRKSIQQIQAKIPNSSYTFQNMDLMIQSLNHKIQLPVSSLARDKLATGQAYQRLGLWNQWKKQNDQAYELLEPTYDDRHKADGLRQLAIVQNCRGQFDSSTQYAKKSAALYRKIGFKEMDEGNLGLSEGYFKKAIDCAKYYEFEHDIDLARSLEGLSEVHMERGEYSLSRALAGEASAIVAKSDGKDSFQFCRFRIKEAHVETQFGSFETAESILNQTLTTVKRRDSVNPRAANQLKSQVLSELARSLLRRSAWEKETAAKEADLVKADAAAVQALQILEGIDQDMHFEIAGVVRLLGEVQLRKGSFGQAKKDFQRSVDLYKYHERTKNGSQQVREKGDVLCLVGNCENLLGQHDRAIENYDQALKTYRRIYGSDHNRHSGMALGNLSRVYISLKEQIKARECLRCSLDILGDILGKDDPDYKRIKGFEDSLNSVI